MLVLSAVRYDKLHVQTVLTDHGSLAGKLC